MLHTEIIAVCSQIHTKHINTLCGQNVEFFNVKALACVVSMRLTMVYSTITRTITVTSSESYCPLFSVYNLQLTLLIPVTQAALNKLAQCKQTSRTPSKLPCLAFATLNLALKSAPYSGAPRIFFPGGYARNFFGRGFNKFNWGQRAERTGIWGQ
jgi:hypothetical protein